MRDSVCAAELKKTGPVAVSEYTHYLGAREQISNARHWLGIS